MKFKFLGTAAAEALPAPFCACDRCRAAREEGGRSLRGRSQALVDTALLIDFPAETAYRGLMGKVDLTKVKHCLITHPHQDHLYADEAAMLQPGFSHPANDIPLTFYGTKETLAPFHAPNLRSALEGGRIVLQEITPFVPFTVDRYTVVAFPANHGTKEPVFYQISDGETTILYAHDTGIFFDDVWAWMAEQKPQYDFVTMDCTGGDWSKEYFRNGHMSLGSCREVLDRLQELGCIKKNARTFVNHFTHNCVGTHSELCAAAEKYGFEVSYDDCEITIKG